jgi:hypothetical protein
MKPLCLLFLSAAAAFAQPFTFGVKGGMPMTDFLKVARTQNFTASTATNRYIVGATAELRLPFGLAWKWMCSTAIPPQLERVIGNIATNVTNTTRAAVRGVSAAGEVSFQEIRTSICGRGRNVGQTKWIDADGQGWWQRHEYHDTSNVSNCATT